MTNYTANDKFLGRKSLIYKQINNKTHRYLNGMFDKDLWIGERDDRESTGSLMEY